MSALRLRPLRLEDEDAARRAHDELAADGFDFLLDWDPSAPWLDHLAWHDRLRCGVGLPPDRVPATFLVAEVAGELVGRVSVRHELDTFLAELGGHVGYGVRPAFRRRGHATEMLRQGLVVARAAGVDRVLVTCEEGNAASARVIERLGGTLEDVRADLGGGRKRRFWIA